MEGPSSFTAKEWQALSQVIPGGGSEADVELREKLFKELVVRAAACPDKRFKAKCTAFKGTLKLFDVKEQWRVVLGKHGISQRCIEAIMAILGQAFNSAEMWVDCISVVDKGFIDMNQFHAFVIYIAGYLGLAASISKLGLSESSSGAVDAKTLQGLLATIRDPRQAQLRIPWSDIDAFRRWLTDPEAAVAELAGQDGSLTFDKLVDACILQVVQATVLSDSTSKGCRKRAFQLLQALNNTPSLPDSVPGPLSARSTVSESAKSSHSASTGFCPITSQWLTSNRQGFKQPTPREPQGLYAPSHRNTQRDMGWRIFPVQSNVRQTKSKFAAAGEAIATR